MTQDEILTDVANNHSYNSWGELMYDSHDHTQIDCTKEAMSMFSSQEITEFKEKLKSAIIKMIDKCEDTDDLPTPIKYIDLIDSIQ